MTAKTGTIIWANTLPRPPTAEVMAWSGVPPAPFFEPARTAGLRMVEANSPRTLAQAIAEHQADRAVVFLYAIEPWHLPVLARHAGRIPFILYYQNAWPRHLPWLKRWIVRWVLERVDLVLLQDRLCLEHFGTQLPPEKIRFFPWHVDETFFDPALVEPTAENATPWLFVPGDRDRLDQMVITIAERTGMRVLRVSRHFAPGVLEAYARLPNVEVRHFVPWAELRSLYGRASVVLNVADDRHTSAGMTTFLEALAMNARVVTPAGHSSAGFCFADGTLPYETVEDVFDADQWVEAIRRSLPKSTAQPGRSPRDLFLEVAGSAATAQRWRRLLQLANTPVAT